MANPPPFGDRAGGAFQKHESGICLCSPPGHGAGLQIDLRQSKVIGDLKKAQYRFLDFTAKASVAETDLQLIRKIRIQNFGNIKSRSRSSMPSKCEF